MINDERAFRFSIITVLAFGAVWCASSLRQKGIGSTELKQLSFFNDYSVKTDDVEKELEKLRIERDVALTAIGHPSLTAVPKHDPKWKREQLRRLKERALDKLDRLSRGRHTDSYGLSDDEDDDDSSGSGNDCDPEDDKLGLCGVHVPNPAEQELKDKEALISQQLDTKEQKDDQQRKAVMMQINTQRLLKAKKLMKDLIQTDQRINDLVHHAIKVAAMAPHTPSP